MALVMIVGSVITTEQANAIAYQCTAHVSWELWLPGSSSLQRAENVNSFRIAIESASPEEALTRIDEAIKQEIISHHWGPDAIRALVIKNQKCEG